MTVASASVFLHLAPAAITLQGLGDIGQIATGVTSLAVFITLAFLWRQLRQAELVSRTELISAVARAFVDFPRMRPYFYAGISPPDDDREQALAIAIALASAMDHVAARFRTPGMSKDERKAWERYFDDIKDQSPIFVTHVKEHRNWYGRKFRDHFSA